MITQQENIDSGVNLALESLSACMDGELLAAQRGELFAKLGAEQGLQAQWSLYHCIGDVLRSDELSCHTDGFNARFATKLAAEAHVFAPRAARAIAARQAELHRSRWIKPASLVASMAAVAVVAGVAMQQWRGTMNGDVSTAMAPPGVSAPQGMQKASVESTGQMAQASLPSVYLAAHRQYASQRTALYVQTVAHDSGK